MQERKERLHVACDRGAVDTQRRGGLGLPPASPLTLTPVVEHLMLAPSRHKGAVTVVVAPTSSPPADLIPRHTHLLHTSDNHLLARF